MRQQIEISTSVSELDNLDNLIGVEEITDDAAQVCRGGNQNADIVLYNNANKEGDYIFSDPGENSINLQDNIPGSSPGQFNDQASTIVVNDGVWLATNGSTPASSTKAFLLSKGEHTGFGKFGLDDKVSSVIRLA